MSEMSETDQDTPGFLDEGPRDATELRRALDAARGENRALHAELARLRLRVLEQARALEVSRLAIEEWKGLAERGHEALFALRDSRTFRLQQAYARLYDAKGLGPAMRAARRVAVAAMRAARR